jgi:2-succinyl-5-enolpyruvyl-6-hydroxy-3-cyclohexene-1-carboxylate synthase
MSTPPAEDVQATFVATLVDEWIRHGLRHAVVCPGSRNTPLAVCLADRPDLALHVHHDERSAGFLALGLGMATGRAAVVVTTSGTAAVELHPAVVEAHHAGVPLLVCTADRPPELQDVGAPQTIEQTHLFGRAVRWFADPGIADAATSSRWRAFASHALAETAGPPAGPVHLNLPFREPLVGRPRELPPSGEEAPRTSGAGVRRTASPPIDDLVGRRGVILAGEGGGHDEADGGAVIGLAETLGWPVVPDPRSPAWTPGPVAVAHLDGILRSERGRTQLRPEVILRLGGPPASRLVTDWLADSGAREIVVSPVGWSDPSGTASRVVRADPIEVVAGLRARLSGRNTRTEGEWLATWMAASAAAEEALHAALEAAPEPNEPAVARQVAARLPAGAWLVVASSMPVRDLERYAAPRSGLRVVANRGANGIDGVLSTAVGVAQGTGQPTGLLIGDLAFLHDSNGLLGVSGRGIDLVCVVVDNDGGGIFSFLPQARLLPRDRFEKLLGTPHGLDLLSIARAYGVHAQGVRGHDELGAAVDAAVAQGGVHVLVVRTDRATNVDVHRQLDHAMAVSVDAALGAEPVSGGGSSGG